MPSWSPLMALDARERLEALEDALARFREAADGAIVVVEGARDVAALAALGIPGEAAPVNTGAALEVFIDRLVETANGRRVVVMVDWDRTGGRLAARLRDGLQARVAIDLDARRLLSRACHVKALEEVPSELDALRRLAARR